MEDAKSFLSIPCHWNEEVIRQILNKNDSKRNIIIKEIYGTISNGPIGHGRNPDKVSTISRSHALRIRKYIESCNLEFSYLLNTPSVSLKKDNIKLLKDYLDWIVNDFKADAITIASHNLMKLVRKLYPNIKINISTIAGVLNSKEVENFLDINPSKIIVHHDANRNFYDLKKIVKKSDENNIEVEVMTTESCLRNCPKRKAHYEYTGKGKPDRLFHLFCNTRKFMTPLEILKANFIRPEDMHLYEEIEINHFKITGRSKPPSWLPEVVNAYLNRRYEGNLLRLLGIDPDMNAEKWVFLNNPALDGFLEGFLKCKNKTEENSYCNKWIIKLFKGRDFKVKDFSYINKNGILTCRKMGKIYVY